MSSRRSRLVHLLGGLSLALAPLAALADFAGDVTVQLLAPGGTTAGGPDPIALSQTVTVANLGNGVLAPNLGGSGDVSGYMLDNERVFFAGNSILIRVAVGDASGGVYTTGYLGSGGQAARYQLDGLSIPGQAITGFTVYAFDGFATSGPASASGLLSPAIPATLVQLVDADSVAFTLDSLVFKQRFAGESNNFAEFRIDLLTSPVPEPAAALLLAGGLLVLLRRHATHRE